MDRLLDSLFPNAESIPHTWRLEAPWNNVITW